MATLIQTDGTRREVARPRTARASPADRVRHGRGGYLDDDSDHIMIIEEEGKLKHKPLNEEATKVYGRWPAYFIVGHALVCAPGELR
jgi:hypothetical protein